MNMNKVSCGVIRDLIPNCIDGIASEESEALVREHIARCEECRASYESMRGSIEGAEETEPEKKEIEYLRKNKKRNRNIVLFSVLGAALIILAAVFLKLFVIGSYADGEDFTCSVKVVGNKVKVKGELDPKSGKRVSRLVFGEEDGTVTVKLRTVLSPFLKGGDFSGEYEAGREVVKVVFNDSPLWTRDPMRPSFGDPMREDLIEAWERWNELSREEQLVSSSSPGYQSRYFTSWDDAVRYFGVEPVNPFENAKWVEKMNWVGTDKTDEITGELDHANLVFFGTEEGDVSYAGLTAGYTMKVMTGFVVKTETADISRPLIIFGTVDDSGAYYVYDEDSEIRSFIYEPGMIITRPSGEITLTYETYGGDKDVRLTFTAEPLSRLASDEELAGGKRYQYSSGVIFVASTEEQGDSLIARIFYSCKGIYYTVTVYDLSNEEEAGVVIDHVINFIDRSLKGTDN